MNKLFGDYTASAAFSLTLPKRQIEVLLSMRGWHDHYIEKAAKVDAATLQKWERYGLKPSGPSYFYEWYGRGLVNALISKGLIDFVPEERQRAERVGDVLLTDAGMLMSDLLVVAGYSRVHVEAGCAEVLIPAEGSVNNV